MIVAVELARDGRGRTPYDWRERRGLVAYRHALARGVLLRPLGNVLYLMPPYCITSDEIALLGVTLAECVDAATAAA